MKNRIFTCTLFIALFCNNFLNAQTYILDWGSSFSPAWANGNTGGTAINIAGSGVTATVSMAFTGTGAYGAGYPSINNNNATAGNFQVQNSTDAIEIDIDLANKTSYHTTTIIFSSPVKNLSFSISDIDKSSGTTPYTYLDQVIISGTSASGTVNPSLSKYLSNSAFLDITGNTSTAQQTATSINAASTAQGSPSQDATIFVNFGSNAVTSITIQYGVPNIATVQANPALQAIAIGNFSLTRVNIPPVADNFIYTPIPQGNSATLIPGLVAADADGTVANYTIATVPAAAQGVLSYCNNGTEPCTGTVTAVTAGTVLTPAQMATLKFDPAANFTGTAQFTFTATDNTGNISNTATYQLPVTPQPPVSNNIMENSMPNTNGPAAIQGLNSSDIDGTIAAYTITSIPPAGEGTLSYCSNGTEPCTGTVTAITAGTVLTAAQMATLKFDPDAGFTGNSTFNYNAVDNSGNVSNTANYTIPVTASATTARPPLAGNITAQTLNNSLGATAIPQLLASDLDGTVASYTISTIPAAAQGVLTCCGGTVVTAGQVLTPAQATTLQFDPAPTFTGTAAFTYTATDNTGLISNTATYNLPVVNTAPVSSNLTASIPFNAAATAIPALSALDADGTIANYTIATIPTAIQGVLFYCSNGTEPCTGTVIAVIAGTVLTGVQAATLKFDPATGFSGTAPFTYTSTDNNGNISAPATYNLTVAAQPPVSNDVTAPVMPNANAATAISPLNATDADGTIASYNILSIPPTTQGVLSIPCPATPTGATCTGGFANLTNAVLVNFPNGIPLTPAQAAGIRFDPAATFTGVASFSYNATDNSGLVSNNSNYSIPVSGTGNIPPVANNITTPLVSNTAGAAAIPALVGTDFAGGTIAGYTLTSVPSASQGVISIPCPATPTGATCTGGFADLTPAVLAANPAGIVLTTVQAVGMRFDPAAGFSGTVNFSYFTTDNSGANSNTAYYTIPVISTPPVAQAVVIPPMSHNNAPTVIPGLIATDADGTIATYYIESLPLTSQGVISIPCPPTPTGAACTGGFANLTAAVLVNYTTTGIPLTPTQMAGMRFDPASGYSGNVVFNYHSTDNSGLISNTTTYTIPVSGLPPVSNNVVTSKIPNISGSTPIPALSSTDADGSIGTYVINNVPPASQGVLYLCNPACAAVIAGQVLTPAEAALLQFDPAAGYIGNITFNYAAYDNSGSLSNVSAYTIPVGTATTLPLTLISFTGSRNGNDIAVNWKAEAEVNVSRYELEYSTNGSTYSVSSTVSALNTATSNYQFTLVNYTQPVYYLRLKMIDIDGQYTYSNVIVVRMNGVKNQISIYPNPATDFVNAVLGANAKGDYKLQLIDAAGRTVNIINVKNAQGNQLVTIPRGSLANGMYVLKITSTYHNETTLSKVIFK